MTLVSIDDSGCIHLPQAIRDQLKLKSNEQLYLEIQDNILILKPISKETELFYEDGVLVFESNCFGNVDSITDELRQERINQIMSW